MTHKTQTARQEHRSPRKSIPHHSGALGLHASNDDRPGPEALEEWKESKTGPLANLTFSGRPFIWARIPENDPIFEEYGPDPASGENAPHIEIIPGVRTMRAQTVPNHS